MGVVALLVVHKEQSQIMWNKTWVWSQLFKFKVALTVCFCLLLFVVAMTV